MAPQPIECERWLGLYTDLLAGQRRLSAVMYQFRGALNQAYLQKLQTVALLNEVKRRAITAGGAPTPRLLPRLPARLDDSVNAGAGARRKRSHSTYR